MNENDQKLKEIFSPSAEINRLQILNDFNQQSMLQQPRNRLGLLISPHVEVPSPISESTPVQTPIQSRSKQGSPLYAEPADALAAGNVVRRSQRNSLLPKSQRHSEPPKGGGLRPTQFCQVLSPIDSEKSHHISGSLDELKKKTRGKPPRSGRLDPWPVDSSWEFMGNDDDYDTDANWRKQPNTNGNVESTNNVKRSPVLNSVAAAASTPNQENRITINQIIAKKLPELNIPELLQNTVQATPSPDISRSDGTLTSFGRGNRLSAYDNVERGGHSGYATSLICHDSANSDDGTVFSEPWDSSQWDSFLPHDGMLEIVLTTF